MPEQLRIILEIVAPVLGNGLLDTALFAISTSAALRKLTRALRDDFNLDIINDPTQLDLFSRRFSWIVLGTVFLIGMAAPFASVLGVSGLIGLILAGMLAVATVNGQPLVDWSLHKIYEQWSAAFWRGNS